MVCIDMVSIDTHDQINTTFGFLASPLLWGILNCDLRLFFGSPRLQANDARSKHRANCKTKLFTTHLRKLIAFVVIFLIRHAEQALAWSAYSMQTWLAALRWQVSLAILATPSSGHIWPNSISLHFRSKLSCVIALLCILRHHCRNYFVFARHFRSCTLIISRFPQRYLCFINCAESVSLLLKGKLLGYDLTASFVLFSRPPVEANSMEPESAKPHAAWRKKQQLT